MTQTLLRVLQAIDLEVELKAVRMVVSVKYFR